MTVPAGDGKIRVRVKNPFTAFGAGCRLPLSPCVFGM